MQKWICCQIGAREHYAIPRALHKKEMLAHLLTDAWLTPAARLNHLPISKLAGLRERFSPDLTDAPVYGFTTSLLCFELQQQILGRAGWQQIMARNCWFQRQVVRTLPTITRHLNGEVVLFAYSYAALDIFRYAKARGWRAILGQIDPGPVEERIVLQEHERYPAYSTTWQPAPVAYWQQWREECALADEIIVNSPWSRSALQQSGISTDKINVIPLAYTIPPEAANFERTYPIAFTAERPLRVLFLGQVILRKGIMALLAAAELLRDHPIEFWLVGTQGITRSEQMVGKKNVKWIGSVARSTTANYYQQADLLLFPTLSDGFGITQLEAQAWKLPLIVSHFCGQVVEDKVNGLLLSEVSGESVANALQICLANPELLQRFSNWSVDLTAFGLHQLQNQLQALA